MPEGILIIDWDEFEGGFISFKYPDMKIPDNLVQLLQISHSFNPGLINIQEEGFHALSIGNDDLQKVIVLILTAYEDANDFEEIMEALNRIIKEPFDTVEMMHAELQKVYGLSQTVFRAREAVLKKLTTEVTQLKNREHDLRRSLRWFRQQETPLEIQILLILCDYQAMTFDELLKELSCDPKVLKNLLSDMVNQKKIALTDKVYSSLIHYLV